MRIRLIAAATLGLVLACLGCGSVTDPSKNTTETFTGTVAPGGRSTIHSFNISSGGEYTMKVTSMTPTFNSFFGTWLGIIQGNDCGLFQQNTLSIVGSQSLAGPIFQKGTYCAFVFDVGTMTTTETYTLTVSHP
jgi:hypothetical protein